MQHAKHLCCLVYQQLLGLDLLNSLLQLFFYPLWHFVVICIFTVIERMCCMLVNKVGLACLYGFFANPLNSSEKLILSVAQSAVFGQIVIIGLFTVAEKGHSILPISAFPILIDVSNLNISNLGFLLHCVHSHSQTL